MFILVLDMNMQIALTPEACEGGIRPLETTTACSSTNFQSLHCDSKNLPYQTLRAHQRALSVSGLPQRARCALAALAQTVDRRKPLASIFAHRDYLAARAGLSERTWYRAEHDLVEAGLITIAEQTRKTRHGRFGAAYIYLSEAAATLLGLLGEEATLGQRAPRTARRDGEQSPSSTHDAAAASSVDAHTDESASRAREVPGDAPAEHFDVPPSANLADPYTDVYRSPDTSQKRQQARLPSDVQPLVSLGFHENYIFKLMKLARVEHQKRLGDVVEACWENLKKATRPIPYLRILLRSSTDFTWLASQRRAAKLADETRAQECATLEQAAREIAGGAFVSRGGNVRYRISDDGQVLTSYDAREGRERIATTGWLQGFVHAIRAGDVMSPVSAPAARPSAANERNSCDADIRRGHGVHEARASLSSIAQMRAQLRSVTGGMAKGRAVGFVS